MSDRRQYRPEWYYHGLLLSWGLWALGTYEARRKNWRIRYFALGPLRLRFVRLQSNAERRAYG